MRLKAIIATLSRIIGVIRTRIVDGCRTDGSSGTDILNRSHQVTPKCTWSAGFLDNAVVELNIDLPDRLHIVLIIEPGDRVGDSIQVFDLRAIELRGGGSGRLRAVRPALADAAPSCGRTANDGVTCATRSPPTSGRTPSTA
jgi:hypothetical protein